MHLPPYISKFVAAIAVIVGSLLGGCTIVESVEVEIRYAPQFHAKFDVNRAPVKINSARFFIYNSADILVEDTTVTGERLASDEPLILLKGVAEGQYWMSCYCNAENMFLGGAELGVSRKDELRIDLQSLSGEAQNFPSAGLIDSLCHWSSSFVLMRGNPTVETAQIGTAHYCIDLNIVGLDRLTSPLGQLAVNLLDLPRSLDAMRGVQERQSLGVALSCPSTDQRMGQLMTLYFGAKDQVKLSLVQDGVVMQNVLLEPERYVEPTAPNKLNITIQFYADSYIIQVNDWIVGEYEIAEMGG